MGMREEGPLGQKTNSQASLATASGDAMLPESILPLLGGEQPGGLHCFAVLDSTMERCALLAKENAPEGAVVAADRQTAGVGRLGRDFYSPPGVGIYLSMLLRPRPGEELALLTSFLGLAVCRAIGEVSGLSPAIKWPNDLILREKKLSGILVRLISPGGRADCAILGVGVNVGQDSFPEELAEKAISLKMAGAVVSRPALAAAVLRHLNQIFLRERWLGAPPPEALAELRGRSCTLGREVVVSGPGETLTGRAAGLDDKGALLVDTPEGRRVVSSGEVSVRGLAGYL